MNFRLFLLMMGSILVVAGSGCGDDEEPGETHEDSEPTAP